MNLLQYHRSVASVPVSLISREADIQPASKSLLQEERVQLKGNNYTAVLLKDQGYYSRTFKIKPAFKYSEEEHIPAILK